MGRISTSPKQEQGRHEQDGRNVGYAVHAREHVLASVQSPSLINAKKGVFGVTRAFGTRRDTGQDDSGLSAILCDSAPPTTKV
jgi:hypothetical protein